MKKLLDLVMRNKDRLVAALEFAKQHKTATFIVLAMLALVLLGIFNGKPEVAEAQ